MGIFGNLFGNNETNGNNDLPWISLTNENQLPGIISDSYEKTQLIFKHSTTCGISNMVLNSFTRSFDLDEAQMALYFLDLHAYRPVSNAVATTFQVTHQSPQVLIIKEGKVVFHTSHGSINAIQLADYIK